MDVGLRGLTDRLDLLPRSGAILVLAVANGLDHVRLVQLCHQGGVGALQIITVEIDHRSKTPFRGTDRTGIPSNNV